MKLLTITNEMHPHIDRTVLKSAQISFWPLILRRDWPLISRSLFSRVCERYHFFRAGPQLNKICLQRMPGCLSGSSSMLQCPASCSCAARSLSAIFSSFPPRLACCRTTIYAVCAISLVLFRPLESLLLGLYLKKRDGFTRIPRRVAH